jgi:hypothetical protein
MSKTHATIIDTEDFEDSLEKKLDEAHYFSKYHPDYFLNTINDFLSLIRSIPDFNADGEIDVYDKYLGFRGICRTEDHNKILHCCQFCFENNINPQFFHILNLIKEMTPERYPSLLDQYKVQDEDVIKAAKAVAEKTYILSEYEAHKETQTAKQMSLLEGLSALSTNTLTDDNQEVVQQASSTSPKSSTATSQKPSQLIPPSISKAK